MKTFNDLKFGSHPLDGVMATLQFDNGYGVSVISGSYFYCTPGQTYELAMTDNTGHLVYCDIVNHDVLGHLTPDEVSQVMATIQALEPGSVTSSSYALDDDADD